MHTIELEDGNTVRMTDIVKEACTSLHISGGTSMFEEKASKVIGILQTNDTTTYDEMSETMGLDAEIASAVINQFLEKKVIVPTTTPNTYATNVKAVTSVTEVDQSTSEAPKEGENTSETTQTEQAAAAEETQSGPVEEVAQTADETEGEDVVPDTPAPSEETATAVEDKKDAPTEEVVVPDAPDATEKEDTLPPPPKEVKIDLLTFIPETTLAKVNDNDRSRLRMWMEKLTKFGYYTPEVAGKICAYAHTESGYVPRKFGGASLVGMFDSIGFNLSEKMRMFVASDAEYIVQKVIQFLKARPLGASVDAWARYENDHARYSATLRYFGIAEGRNVRTPPNQLALRRVLDTAIPPRNIPSHLVAGNYAERLHYLMFAIAHLMTICIDKKLELFAGMFHNKPTEAYIKMHTPNWVKTPEDGGKKVCSVCGSELVFSNGIYRCSNFLCPKSIGMAITEAVPFEYASERSKPGKNRKDRKENYDELPLRKKGKPNGGRKNRPVTEDVDDGDDAGSTVPAPTETVSDKIVYSSGEMTMTSPFANLTLPTK